MGSRENIGNTRLHRVVDNDALGSLQRRRQTLCNHEGDRFTHVSHDRTGQEGHGQGADRTATRSVHSTHERQGANAVGIQIVTCDHSHHAIDAIRRRRVDAPQIRRRVRGSNDNAVELPGKPEIVSEPALPPQQPAVLQTAGRLNQRATRKTVDIGR